MELENKKLKGRYVTTFCLLCQYKPGFSGGKAGVLHGLASLMEIEWTKKAGSKET